MAEVEYQVEEEKRLKTKKRSRKEAGEPMLEPMPAKRQQTGSSLRQPERDLALARQLVSNFSSLEHLLWMRILGAVEDLIQ